MKKRIIIYTSIGLTIIILTTLGILGLTYQKENSLPKDNINENNIDEETDSKENIYINFYEFDGHWCQTNTTNCNIKYEIRVDTDKAKILAYANYDKEFILIDNNGIELIDVENNKREKLNLENTYNNYYLKTSSKEKTEAEETVIGISFIDKEDIEGYYDIETQKIFLSDNTEESIKPLDEEYILKSNTNEYKIIRIKDNKEIYYKQLSNENNSDINYMVHASIYILESNNNKAFIFNEQMSDEIYSTNIINTNGDIILENLDNNHNVTKANTKISTNDGKIYAYKNGNLIISDFEGNISITKELKLIQNSKINNFIKNYLLFIKDNTIYLKNLDNYEEQEIYKLESEEDLHYWPSPDYYLKSPHYNHNSYVTFINEEPYDKEGIYMTVVDYKKTNEKNESKGYANEIFYDLKTKEVKVFEFIGVGNLK